MEHIVRKAYVVGQKIAVQAIHNYLTIKSGNENDHRHETVVWQFFRRKTAYLEEVNYVKYTPGKKAAFKERKVDYGCGQVLAQDNWAFF